MKHGYERLICALSAIGAAVCMIGTPVSAESYPAGTEDSRLCAMDHIAVMQPVIMAEENSGEVSESDRKTKLKEQAKNSRQLYACIGGGVIVVVALICLLADKKK